MKWLPVVWSSTKPFCLRIATMRENVRRGSLGICARFLFGVMGEVYGRNKTIIVRWDIFFVFLETRDVRSDSVGGHFLRFFQILAVCHAPGERWNGYRKTPF